MHALPKSLSVSGPELGKVSEWATGRYLLHCLSERGPELGKVSLELYPETMRPQTPWTHRRGGRRFLVRLSSELKVLKVLSRTLP